MIINLGDAPFKAFITVTYPKGTCTVSDGTTTYSHSGGGTYTFTVKKKGTYTVKIQYSTAVKSTTVNITKRGQATSVSLDYKLYLYNAGNTPLTISFESEQTEMFGVGTLEADCIQFNATEKWYGDVHMITTPATDLTPYSTAKVVVENEGSKSTFYIGFGKSAGAYDSADYTIEGALTKTTISINISSLNGNHYLSALRKTNETGLGTGLGKIYSVLLDV